MSDIIAFIGVGNMGNPMAENLLKSGKKIRVFDISNKMIDLAKEKGLKFQKYDEFCTLNDIISSNYSQS